MKCDFSNQGLLRIIHLKACFQINMELNSQILSMRCFYCKLLSHRSRAQGPSLARPRSLSTSTQPSSLALISPNQQKSCWRNGHRPAQSMPLHNAMLIKIVETAMDTTRDLSTCAYQRRLRIKMLHSCSSSNRAAAQQLPSLRSLPTEKAPRKYLHQRRNCTSIGSRRARASARTTHKSASSLSKSTVMGITWKNHSQLHS